MRIGRHRHPGVGSRVGPRPDHGSHGPARYPDVVPRPRRRALGTAATLCLAVLAGCSPDPATGPPDVTAAVAPSASPTPGEEARLSDELDDTTAVGTVVDGFPTDLLPVPADAEVLVSSAQPLDDGRLRVSLNLRSGADAATLLESFRAPLLAAGFTEAAPPEPEPGLAAQATFARADGTELVVVGILDRDGMRTMTLGGTLAPAAP